MSIYAGLDVSDKTTHICVVTGDGAIVRRDVVASDPDGYGDSLLNPQSFLFSAAASDGDAR